MADGPSTTVPTPADNRTHRRIPFSVALSRLCAGDWRDVPDFVGDPYHDAHLHLGWLERDALGRELAGVGRE